jgi:hypothetical protein
MSYKIKSYTKSKAEKLGVIVKPSTVQGKKIDVFNKKGEKLASIGALGYGDYPTFMAEEGKEYADKRRKAYKSRHESDRHVRGSAGFYADQLLWLTIIILSI